MRKVVVFLLALIILTGCSLKNMQETVQNEIRNTTWIASDGSEVVFGEKEIHWYQEENIHDDNFYAGTYEYYRGSEAINFITTELSSYGITEEKLEKVFASNDQYSEDNFVVFNIVYSSLTIDGKISEPAVSLVPWFGFILEDGTYLDVANMNTGTYYAFTKK